MSKGEVFGEAMADAAARVAEASGTDIGTAGVMLVAMYEEYARWRGKRDKTVRGVRDMRELVHRQTDDEIRRDVASFRDALIRKATAPPKRRWWKLGRP
jgi:hypothetical protein